jgi:hypothetical protein
MTSPTQPVANPRKGPTKVWLPVVLVMGLILGLAIAYLPPNPYNYLRNLPPDFQGDFVVHTILSTMSIVLLVALTAIYLNVYAETRARFALGITVVLFALLVQSLFQYPLILNMQGPFPVRQGRFLSYADVFTVAAYTLFLYLSLE